jgi:hypothetical protein
VSDKGLDLTTADGIEAYVTGRAIPFVLDWYKDEKDLRPMAHLFVTRDKHGVLLKNGAVGSQVIFAPTLGDAPERDVFAQFIRDQVTRVRAIGVLMIRAAWMLGGAAAAAAAADRTKSISNHPERYEAAWLSLEHIAVRRVWYSRIARNDKGMATLAPFERITPNPGDSGRFMNLLCRERFA